MRWFFEAFKKYAISSGRARRKEYFGFIAFSLFINLILILFYIIFGFNMDSILFKLHVLFNCALILPFCSVSYRRLHDVGESGLIPREMFYFWQEGDIGPNKYGDDPKMEERNLKKLISMSINNENSKLNETIILNQKIRFYGEPKINICYLNLKKNQKIIILEYLDINGIKWNKVKTEKGDEGWCIFT
ncbi:MAG: DUF805 domain-containing protein [Bacteroidales bacterium]|jgi:uncharacterized membrane protein YhaH (DUF805 family)|nr:DUF805 domain-containing protein [Bacteroidales bacterium]